MPSKNQPSLLDIEQELLVLSASRRTDLVACYPDYLIEKLQDYSPELVHTIVLWTKNPENLITNQHLRKTLARYSQLYIHLTITGLGASVLEPRIPAWQEVTARLAGLVEFAGDARRINWRFDPIIRAEVNGQLISNIELFDLVGGATSH